MKIFLVLNFSRIYVTLKNPLLFSLPHFKMFYFFMLKEVKASIMLEYLSAHGLLSWHRQAHQLNSISYQLRFTTAQQK